MTKHRFIIAIFLSVTVAAFWFCDTGTQKVTAETIGKDTLLYLNHADSAKYVGMNTCRLCHQDIYNTFIKTGMGRSFEVASRGKSAGDFSSASFYDRFSDLHYRALWEKDSLLICEYRLAGTDTLHRRTEQVNYIIGSGQHTNSHLQSVNGYVNQMPMTFYTQKKRWDLPPGFENGFNTRFNRKIGLECMSCHNGYPDFVLGSENKYSRLPNGIDCERCHGPGSIHVAQRQNGSRVDTSKYIDYSIVNPAKLPVEAQFDICQRCHLQGNAILKEGKSFFDFRPGQKLSDYISVFLSKYSNADDEFIMASHADRLRQSACFIKSVENLKGRNALKPYKDALTCVTCHNPHVSVRETNVEVFNDACRSCHENVSAGDPDGILRKTIDAHRLRELRKAGCGLSGGKKSDCVKCHMPVSGSVDIPHVTVHDHYIRKPVSKNEKDKIKTFIGLFSINERSPDDLTRARAYINQYDKFNADPCFLDSAARLLNKKHDPEKNCYALFQLWFIRQDYKKIIALVNELGEDLCYNRKFNRRSYDNKDAWAAYRIAEAFYNTGDNGVALKWFERAVQLAPYYPEFRNKYASALISGNRLLEAEKQYTLLLDENPAFVPAFTNLGYIRLAQGRRTEALKLYTEGEKLDPDNEPLLLNLAGYYAALGDKIKAKGYLEKVVKKNPANHKAQMALQQLKR